MEKILIEKSQEIKFLDTEGMIVVYKGVSFLLLLLRYHGVTMVGLIRDKVSVGSVVRGRVSFCLRRSGAPC